MGITLHEMLFNLYGVSSHYAINKKESDVDIAMKRIIDNNPNRASFLIVNLSANQIYVSPQNDVSSTKGIYVAPNGGTMLMQWDIDFELVTSEFFAVASANNSSVFILENILI